MFYIRRVSGNSMLPALKEGYTLLAVKFPGYNVGDIVIANVNGLEVVKRIAKVVEGKYKLVGDNSKYSTDSREWGLLSKKALKGKVIYKYKHKQK